MLTARIINIPQFCKELSEGYYNDYKPIDVRILTREAYYGLLSREDFHDLIIQEFLKQSAKIWRDKEVYAGAWMNAYKVLKGNYFMHFTKRPFHKNHQVELLGEYRWRIDHARRWFLRHKDFNPLFPSLYFDRTRKDRREGGFEYTKRAWMKKLKYDSEVDVRKHSAERKAQLRAKNINAHKQISWQINAYLNDRIDIETLFAFVNEKYPDYVEHIGDMIQKELGKNK